MGGPARLAPLLLFANAFVYGQEPTKPTTGAGRSPEWIVQVRSEADFELADRAALVEAARAVIRAEGKFPKEVRARALKALFQDARCNQRRADAVAIFEQLREVSPDDPEVRLLHIQQGPVTGSPDIAARIGQLEDFLGRGSPYPPAVRMLTELLITAGRAGDARPRLDAALKEYPRDGLLLAAQAAAWQALGDPGKALEALDAAAACPPWLGFVELQYLARAEALYGLHRPDEALAFCALALHLKPPAKDAQGYLWKVFHLVSRCYQSLGKFELAYFCARAAAKSAPQLPEAWLGLADACVFSGRYAEGQRALDKLAALGPAGPRASFVGSRLKSGLGDDAGALAAVRDSRRAFPDDPDLVRLECALLATARDEAVRDGKRARELATAALAGPGGADPKWLYCAAVAHAAAHDYSAAGDLLAKAEAATASWDGALRRSILETKGQVQKRERILDRMPDPVPDAGDAIRPRVGWITEVTTDWDLELMPVEMATGHCLKVVADETLDIGLRVKATEVLTCLWHKAGRIPEAHHGYKTLVQLDAKNPAYRRGQVAADVVGQPPTDQAAAWERFCAEFPADVEGRALWAHELQRAGNLARAEEVVAVFQREAPDHPRLLHVNAVAAIRRGKYAEAVGLADRWLRRPDQRAYHSLAYVVRAEALTRLSQFDAALADLALAQRLAPNRVLLAPVYRLASRCYLHQDKTALAFQVAERWSATGVNPAEASLAATTAALLGDDLEGAASRLDGLQPASLGPVEVDLVRAVLKLRRGDLPGCRDALDRGLAAHPASEATRCALAMHLTFAPDGKARDARRAFDLARAGGAAGSALEPVWAVCLANAYAEAGDFGRALEVLRDHGGGLDEPTRTAVREAFERRQALRHDHAVSKWMQRQLLLNAQPDGR